MAWADLTRVVALENLHPDESRSYLAARGVPEARQAGALSFTRGHPLALALVADVLRHDLDVPVDDLRGAPDIVRVLVERLVEDAPTQWDGRRHFFAAAAEAMRRILIEHARRKNALKHDGERRRVDLDGDLPPISSPGDGIDDLLALNDSLDRQATEDAAMAELVNLFFAPGGIWMRPSANTIA